MIVIPMIPEYDNSFGVWMGLIRFNHRIEVLTLNTKIMVKYNDVEICIERVRSITAGDASVSIGRLLKKEDIDINVLKEIDPDVLEIIAWIDVIEIKGVDNDIVDSDNWSSYGVI